MKTYKLKKSLTADSANPPKQTKSRRKPINNKYQKDYIQGVN